MFRSSLISSSSIESSYPIQVEATFSAFDMNGDNRDVGPPFRCIWLFSDLYYRSKEFLIRDIKRNSLKGLAKGKSAFPLRASVSIVGRVVCLEDGDHLRFCVPAVLVRREGAEIKVGLNVEVVPSSPLTIKTTEAKIPSIAEVGDVDVEVSESPPLPVVGTDSVSEEGVSDSEEADSEGGYDTEEVTEIAKGIPLEDHKRRKSLFEKLALDALDKAKQGRSPLNKDDMEAVIGWLAWYRGSPILAGSPLSVDKSVDSVPALQVSPASFSDLGCVGSATLKKEAILAGDGVQAAAFEKISSQARQVFVEIPVSMSADPNAGADAVVAGESSQCNGKQATVCDRENMVLDRVAGAAIKHPDNVECNNEIQIGERVELAEGVAKAKAPVSWASVVAANGLARPIPGSERLNHRSGALHGDMGVLASSVSGAVCCWSPF
ncbi:hypothetical protein U1Q18_040714 [Sarracenia purpurea var. burkii]